MAAGLKLMADKEKGSVSCPIKPLPRWRRAPWTKLRPSNITPSDHSFPRIHILLLSSRHLQNAFAVAEVTFQLTFVSGTLGGLFVLLRASNGMLVVVCAS